MTKRNGQPAHRELEGIDVPITRLVPRSKRKVARKYVARIEASLRTVGLIDPLLVYPDGDCYEILDGHIRYGILLEMGVESVPCLVAPEREGFTGNRMVNRLSPAQEMRMLRQSMEELDEQTIAAALGMKRIGHRLNTTLLKKLHPRVAKAFETGTITRQCAREFVHVKPERQAEILDLMQSCNDFGVVFAKGLVLKTPTSKRAKRNGNDNPWTRADERKSDLLKRLKEAEQQQDFYSGLYRQYTKNLLRLLIYVRSLLSNERVRTYLGEHHAGERALVERIIEDSGG